MAIKRYAKFTCWLVHVHLKRNQTWPPRWYLNRSENYSSNSNKISRVGAISIRGRDAEGGRELKCETLTCDSLSNLRLVGGWRHSRWGVKRGGDGKGNFRWGPLVRIRFNAIHEGLIRKQGARWRLIDCGLHWLAFYMVINARNNWLYLCALTESFDRARKCVYSPLFALFAWPNACSLRVEKLNGY